MTDAGQSRPADPIRVDVWRGPIVESVHRVDAVVCDGLGNRLRWWGDPDRVTYWRSSAKPFQAIPVITSGAAAAFGIGGAEPAVLAASHSGQDEHVDVVEGILHRLNLPESALQCGTHPPLHAPTAERLVREGLPVGPLRCNCSGKHAGMLATASHLGAPLESYRSPDHPVQRLILGVVSRFAGVPADEIPLGVDGCGVPVFALPLWAMATAYARLAGQSGYEPLTIGRASTKNGETSDVDAARVIARAMVEHPHMVGGTGRFDTVLMEAAGGALCAKGGAEGVHCMVDLNRGWGIALKVSDGSGRAVAPAALALAILLGLVHADAAISLASYMRPVIKNNLGESVGELRAHVPGA